MVAPNYSDLCTEAERYYYDFLFEGTQQSLPYEIFNHIIVCKHCHEKINQLETMLSEGEEHPSPDIKHHEKVVTTMLKLHFAHVGKQVTCATVRPFLSSQLIPALLMRIPTPITAHLDNCEQCREDLKRLQNLGLSHKQLTTLSQMFADDLTKNDLTCAEARKSIPDVVAMAFDHTDAKILRHLSLCPECREELYKSREVVLQQTKSSQSKDNTGHKELDCQSVTSSDIFDYCIPYGIDPAKDEYVKFRKSLTSHIIRCADCLDKIQQLHRKIYEIIDRPESGVATIFRLDTSSRATPQTVLDNLYADFPVQVEVSDLKEVSASRKQPCAEKFNEPVKLKSFSNNIRPYVKIALPVAAVIVVAFGLLLSLPSAKALTIEQIQKAILKVKNVHIASFIPGKTEPTQEEWVSRQPEIYIMKTGQQLAIWDVNGGVRKKRVNESNRTEQTTLSFEETNKIGAIINGALGLIPFEDISVLPKDAQWNRLADASMPGGDKSILEVYDLVWVERNSLANNKWRVYVDTSTNLPRRTEFYQLVPGEQEYILKSFNIIDYPTDNDIQARIKQLSF